jgi:uncharacterized membrane protein YedE/YeeE
MRAATWAFACGLLFGLGLVVSGMADPANIKGFLDVAGDWRPQLLAVLGSAVVVTTALYAFARRRTAPLAAATFAWPTRTDVDLRLVGGAALFGIGWAVGGFCPGPAIASLGLGSLEAWVFVPAMAAGMWIARNFQKPSRREERVGGSRGE